MVRPIKALFDLNVILDVLQGRQPHFPDSAQAERGALEGYVAAHSWTTPFYCRG